MPEYLAPGVYVEEIERGPKPIEGVATSTAAFLGETERGTDWPTLVTSYNEYLRRFGDVFDDGKYMPHAVKGFFDNGGRRVYITRIVGEGAGTAAVTFGNYEIKAVGPGPAANRTWVRLGQGTTKDKDGNSIGFRLAIYYWDRAGQQPFDPEDDTAKLPRPYLAEVFDDLSLIKDSPNYWDKRVNHGNSALIELNVTDGAQIPSSVQHDQLSGGNDVNTPGADQYQGDNPDPSKRTGLAALELDVFRDIALVYAPGVGTDSAGIGIIDKIVTHCEKSRFRFAVIDAPSGSADPVKLDPRSARESKYAAFYYPWITVSDPRSGARINIPPGGPVLGIYARTDNTRGVFKAPANETVAGALDVEYDIDQGTQENLNPKGVNVIRRFPGRGIRVWGARTLSSDPLNKYVPVRRFLIFAEASIYTSTQWVVFEPNDYKLWARVKQTVTLFLRTQWREGALLGAKEEEAFSVAVGRETMTEDDILNGRLIVEVGVAVVRPAEFVIFRIYQKTEEAKS
ncbi:phage tail sheath family protein [Bradyrhizobium japonicum]|uniref:phage tail sheath family protein n=1 Tax=Bradyrhizobium japonicum TaxID=375 RepID=UPI001BA991C4|nr:phage tail sheath family protein [Bradyrhizobium japonicum]MBR0804352.1 phage tail sheath family protein [Bradyrhizobium japonicum]